MADTPRIAELRRRVDSDPASIAFAQLAEEYRREGDYEQAIQVCHTGLAQYPGYLSARVTLGRALVELGRTDEAQAEFDAVLKVAPDNLAANRALDELRQRGGARTVPVPPLVEAPVSVGADLEVRPEAPSQVRHEVPPPPPAPPAPPPPDPAIARLEAWLQAILKDRTARSRTDAAS